MILGIENSYNKRNIVGVVCDLLWNYMLCYQILIKTWIQQGATWII